MFIEKNPDTAVVQMDSVIGSKGGKCLLTIHFVDCSLMLAFLRDANTSKSVTDIFNQLDKGLTKETFSRLFPVILTDNGSEFSNPKAIEYGESAPFWLQKLNLIYKTCISSTKVAFRLQMFSCQLQRLLFNLQSGISCYY